MEKNRMLSDIGYFYFLKNNQDLKKTNEEIENLKIRNIDFKENILTISLERPGLLIGKRGENFENLKTYLQKNIKEKIKIEIIEDTSLFWLYNYQYTYYQ